MKRPFTPIEIQFVKDHYADHSSGWIAQQLNRPVRSIYGIARRLDLKKSAEFLSSELSGRLTSDAVKGLNTRFKKGKQPWNKGLPFPHSEASIATQFKKGNVPHNIKQDGHERVNEEGYLIRRVNGKYEFVHRLVWIESNGTIPPGMIVAFKDRNKLNCEISNLELITRKENMNRNTIMRYHPELRPLIKTIAKLNTKINEKQNRRSKKSSVRSAGKAE